MININLTNVEELIFKKSEIKSILSDLRSIFDQWLFSYRIPLLHNMRKKAAMDMLNSLNGIHIEKLAKFFQDMVFVEKFDYHTVKNLSYDVDDISTQEFSGYTLISLFRSKNKVDITLMR